MSAKQQYLNTSFLACAFVLLLAAGSKEAVIKILNVKTVKEPIPLQASLGELNEGAIFPYKVIAKSQIDGATLESLGTEEYIQWVLEDTDAAPSSPTRYCSLFITYYTGNPDMVPHVPDECYVGGGNELSSKQTLTLNLPERDSIGFQYVLFRRVTADASHDSTFSVQYLFHANGKYCESRTDTRTTLFNWFSQYSYFSKVEWKFFGRDSFGDTFPDKQQTLDATEKLLAVVLPELENKHWPDWEAANAKQ